MITKGVISIRPFSPADIDHVIRLVKTTLDESYPPSLYFDLCHAWREGFLIAENSGFIIGFIAGIIPQPRQARILMLAVESQHRNQGIGTQLMHSFMNTCGSKGMRSVELEVRQSNLMAINFYKRLGFQLVHTLERFYSNGENGYKMIRYF